MYGAPWTNDVLTMYGVTNRVTEITGRGKSRDERQVSSAPLPRAGFLPGLKM